MPWRSVLLPVSLPHHTRFQTFYSQLVSSITEWRVLRLLLCRRLKSILQLSLWHMVLGIGRQMSMLRAWGGAVADKALAVLDGTDQASNTTVLAWTMC